MTKYVVISTEVDAKRTYGVKIIKEKTVKDISHSRSVVKKLAETCNKAGVEMEQFEDILDNFISDYETF